MGYNESPRGKLRGIRLRNGFFPTLASGYATDKKIKLILMTSDQ